MLRALLFDFHGVLVDDEPIHRELLRQVLAEEGVGLAPADALAQHRGLDDRGRFTAMLEAAGRPASPETLSRLTARKAAYYQRRIRQQGYPFCPGAAELIRAAAEAGLTLGVVSAALREEVEGALEQIAMLQHFKALVTGEDVRASKPDPECYRRGLELLNALPPLPRRLLHPHEVLAIEATPAGLSAAAAAGLLTLGVAHTYSPVELTTADHVVPSLADVSLDRIRELFARP